MRDSSGNNDWMLGQKGYDYYFWDGGNRPYVTPMSFRIIDGSDNAIEAMDVIADFDEGSSGSMGNNFAALNGETSADGGLNTMDNNGEGNIVMIISICIISFVLIVVLVGLYLGCKK